MLKRKSNDPIRDAKVRFWSNTKTGNADQCWPNDHDNDDFGYGRLSIKGKKMRAHRFSYMIHYNLSPEEMKDIVIRHTCDNPACVNPTHLLPGTLADNVQDQVDRNRQRKGEGVPGSKLSASLVKDIREIYATHTINQTKLAELYGVSLGTINDLILGRTWKHVAFTSEVPVAS
jgi:DNA-binding XRE family transcriptional regulator